MLETRGRLVVPGRPFRVLNCLRCKDRPKQSHHPALNKLGIDDALYFVGIGVAGNKEVVIKGHFQLHMIIERINVRRHLKFQLRLSRCS